jgi:hypothetical protein
VPELALYMGRDGTAQRRPTLTQTAITSPAQWPAHNEVLTPSEPAEAKVLSGWKCSALMANMSVPSLGGAGLARGRVPHQKVDRHSGAARTCGT